MCWASLSSLCVCQEMLDQMFFFMLKGGAAAWEWWEFTPLRSHTHPSQGFDCWVWSPFAAGVCSGLVDGCPFQLLAPTDSWTHFLLQAWPWVPCSKNSGIGFVKLNNLIEWYSSRSWACRGGPRTKKSLGFYTIFVPLHWGILWFCECSSFFRHKKLWRSFEREIWEARVGPG